MKIEYRLPRRRGALHNTFALGLPTEPSGHPPRVARLLALAHKLEGLVQSGQVADFVELARLGHISPARLSQILILAQLAPAIQECILFLPAWEDGSIAERDLREIAREVRWDRQQALFAKRAASPGGPESE